MRGPEPGLPAVRAGLQEDVFRSGPTQFGNPLGERLLGHHTDPRMALELLEGALLEGLDDERIGRIGKDDVAAFMEQLRLLQAVDLDLAADVFGALSPFQLDAFDAQLSTAYSCTPSRVSSMLDCTMMAPYPSR